MPGAGPSDIQGMTISDAHPLDASKTAPPPAWLVRLAMVSGGLALLALCVALWAKWGIVLAMSEDFLKACF